LTVIVPDFIAHLPQGEFNRKLLITSIKLAKQLPATVRIPHFGYHRAWPSARRSKPGACLGVFPEHLAAETGISLQALDEIEAESLDPRPARWNGWRPP
jgi:hypothetical protein